MASLADSSPSSSESPIILRTIKEARDFVVAQKKQGHQIGLVPTMGALHQGHGSLAAQAIQENPCTILSIFVNPLQFGVNEDLDRYPRQLAADLALCRQWGITAVFVPEVDELTAGQQVQVMPPPAMTEVLCGRSRPGHFVGVATIVTKLLNIIQPDQAYFGQKDGQQVAIITQLVAQLNLPVAIVPVPTLRESDGLALSSRNVYLTPAERQIAPGLYRGLQRIATAVNQGERRVQVLYDLFMNDLHSDLHNGDCHNDQDFPKSSASESLPRFVIDYIEIVTAATLTPITDQLPEGERIMVAVAAKLGKARLIDNILLDVF